MIIDGVKLQTQKECDAIMTWPSYQSKPDRISDYGCLLTAKVNAFNLFHKGIAYMTLSELNDEMKENQGYFYDYYRLLYSGDISRVKDACLGKESYARREVLNKILMIEDEVDNYTGKIDISSLNEFYYLRTQYQNTGHYSLIVKSDKSYFDSYDGKIKPFKNVLNVYKIRF